MGFMSNQQDLEVIEFQCDGQIESNITLKSLLRKVGKIVTAVVPKEKQPAQADLSREAGKHTIIIEHSQRIILNVKE